jgi:hypothetical protein
MDDETVIPPPLEDDDDDVAWALQTAAVQWQRGAFDEAVVWVRRAVDAAITSASPERTKELGRLAAFVAERAVAFMPRASAVEDEDEFESVEEIDEIDEIDVMADSVDFAPPEPRHPPAESRTSEGPVAFEPAPAKAFPPPRRSGQPPSPPPRPRSIQPPPPTSADEAAKAEADAIRESLLQSEPPPPLAAPEPEPELAPDSEPAPERALDSAPEPEPEFAPDSEPAPELDSEPESAPEPEPEFAPDSEPAPELDSEPEPAPERAPELDSEPEPAPEREPESAPEREPESAPEPEPEPEPEPAPEMATAEDLPESVDLRDRLGLDLDFPDDEPEEPGSSPFGSPSVAPPRAGASIAPSAADADESGGAVDGVFLNAVRGFEDLPEESQERLAGLARIETLARDEEVGAFGAALVTRGAVGVMPAIADGLAGIARPGDVVFTDGSLDEGVALRVVALDEGATVASWSKEVLDEAFAECPWVVDELREVADRFQALAGAVLGELGERLDDSLRAMVTERLETQVLEPSEILVERGVSVPGLLVVGGGRIELVRDGQCVEELTPGAFVFAAEVLSAGPAPEVARAGPGGALVLVASRSTAHELLVSVPPLLELLSE